MSLYQKPNALCETLASKIPGAKVTETKGKKDPVEEASKSELIDTLLGPKPAMSVHPLIVRARVKHDEDRKTYSKRTKADLEDMVNSRQKHKEQFEKISKLADEHRPHLAKVAREAGRGYHSAINQHLASHGVGPMPHDQTRDEMVANAALKLAGALVTR